jgi:hypothetical protein
MAATVVAMEIPMTDLVSAFLRTACCAAPCAQSYVFTLDIYPVWCVACGRMAGGPGGEDMWRLNVEAANSQPATSIERMFYPVVRVMLMLATVFTLTSCWQPDNNPPAGHTVTITYPSPPGGDPG